MLRFSMAFLIFFLQCCDPGRDRGMVATRNEMVAVPGVGTWDVLVMGPSSSKMGGKSSSAWGLSSLLSTLQGQS